MNFGAVLAAGIKSIVDIRRSQGRPVDWKSIQAEVEEMANREFTRPIPLPACPICSQPPFYSIYPNFSYGHRSSTPEHKKFVFFGCQHAQRLAPNFSMMNEEQIDVFSVKWKESIKGLFEEATANSTPEQKAHRAQVLELSYP